MPSIYWLIYHCGLSFGKSKRGSIWFTFIILYLVAILVIFFWRIPLRSTGASSDPRFLSALSRAKAAANNKVHIFKRVKEVAESLEAIAGRSKNNQSVAILSNTFKSADSNKDNYLDFQELQQWIGGRIQAHLQQAIRENFFIFTAVDTKPRNGWVSWEEYHRYFLKNQGFNDSFVDTHMDNSKGMSRDLREAVMRNKAAWAESARSDPSSLTLDEFLSFRHPESSVSNIISIVDDVLGRLDLSGDSMLDKEEYCDLDTNNVPQGKTEEKFKEEKLQEFDSIDKDGSGTLDKRELLAYYDPKHARHSQKEAADLMLVADADGDNRLSLNEVLANAEVFMKSKMVDVGQSMHDEF